MKPLLRKVHRWLGLLMALQIVAWMVSGFYFSLVPIEQVRGEHLTRSVEPLTPRQLARGASTAAVHRALTGEFGPQWRVDSVELVDAGEGLAWRVAGTTDERSFRRLVRPEAETTEAMLDAVSAGQRARDWLKNDADPLAVEWIDAGQGGHDLRGRDGPAWKITFDRPEDVSLYLDPWTGELIARRTPRWRLFDFLWMLHIMDYDARDDFNHPLLQAAAAAGFVVAVSGVVLWVLTRRRRRATTTPG